MTHVLAPFLTGFSLSAALIMAIGAQNLFVLRQGLKRQYVGPVVLFCALSDAVLITAGVCGVGAFLGAMPQLTLFLSIGGAAFLSWYGIKALQRMAYPRAMSVDQGGGMSLGRALASAAAFTFLNPHVYLDTVLLMGTAGASQPEDVRPIFTAGAATASFVWFTSLGYGARLLVPLFARPVAWRVLDAIVGIIMLTLAVSLLVHAFRG